MHSRRVYFILLGVLLAGGLVALFNREREPEYGGKRLSEWVMKLYQPDDPDRAKFKEAAEALRRIGPRAFPYLLRWVLWEPSPWRDKMPSVVVKTFEKLAPNSFPSDRLKYDRGWGSVNAFSILGPPEAAGITQLNSQIQTPRESESASRAAAALAFLGPQGISCLMAALTNQSAVVRLRGTTYLTSAGTNAQPAVPLLIGCLKDTDGIVARDAAYCLGFLRLCPERVVPALAQCVLDVKADLLVREKAAQCLKEFGREARPAIGILKKALDDPDVNIRVVVTNVLQQLDPHSVKGADH